MPSKCAKLDFFKSTGANIPALTWGNYHPRAIPKRANIICQRDPTEHVLFYEGSCLNPARARHPLSKTRRLSCQRSGDLNASINSFVNWNQLWFTSFRRIYRTASHVYRVDVIQFSLIYLGHTSFWDVRRQLITENVKKIKIVSDK
jgi:hypothetical protein